MITRGPGFFPFILIATIALSLAACGGESIPEPSPQAPQEETPTNNPDSPQDPANPADPTDPTEPAPARQEFTPTSFDAPCDVTAPLTEADLDLSNEAVFGIATFEEQQGLAGALMSRTFRRFNEDNVVEWLRYEQFDTDGCLGIASTFEWTNGTQQSVSQVDVLNDDFARDFSPFMPMSTYRAEMEYNAAGDLTRRALDAGNDGEIDHELTLTYDSEGRITLSVGKILTTPDNDNSLWTLEFPMSEATEAYTYDASGNILRKEWTQTHTHTIYEMTYDGNNNRLTQITTRDSQVVFTETNTWDGDKQLTQETTRNFGSNESKQWSYRTNGTLSQLDRYEDFSGNGQWNRNNLYQYDEAGNQTQFKQDQPYDGNFNWQEDSTYNAQNKMLTRIATNLNSQTQSTNMAWTYDADGNEVLEVNNLTGQRTETTYGADGQVILQEWFHGDGSLWLKYIYEYTASGKPLLRTSDHDGDGVPDTTSRWTYDAGENLCHTEINGSNGQVFYLY